MQADMILYNGRFYTMDGAVPRAEAVAVAGNRILAVGESAELRPLLRPGGQALDLEGKAVIPGLVDAHVHFGWYSVALYQQQLDLDNVASPEEALRRVAEQAAHIPPGRWIQGGGWNKNIWPGQRLPTAADLDEIVRHHPVVLADKSRHTVWVNTLALELAGITAACEDPPGGEILRDESGQPTGILLEAATELVYEAIPEPDLETMVAALRQGTAEAQRLGLTGVHDPGHATVLAAFQYLHAQRELGLRALVHIPSDQRNQAIELGLRSGFGDEYVRLGSIKVFADGALGPQTAYMLGPYEGSTEYSGLAAVREDKLRELVSQSYHAGLSVAVHAIGDAANRMTLDAIEEAQRTGPPKRYANLPNRIEHAQLLNSDDLPRLARLGVVASMQPVHAPSDMEIAERHWGRRCDLAYAWRSLLDQGTDLAFGSDAPVETLDPLAGIHAAVTRRRNDGSPGPEGWIPAQRLTVSQAVHAYTMGAAYASGESQIKGSLTPGKLADLVILSEDIFRIPPMEIPTVHAKMTVFDGRIVYQLE